MGEQGPPGDRCEREVALWAVEPQTRTLPACDEHRCDPVLGQKFSSGAQRVPVARDVVVRPWQPDHIGWFDRRVRKLFVALDKLPDQAADEQQVDVVELRLQPGARLAIQAPEDIDEVFLPGVLETLFECVHCSVPVECATGRARP